MEFIVFILSLLFVASILYILIVLYQQKKNERFAHLFQLLFTYGAFSMILGLSIIKLLKMFNVLISLEVLYYSVEMILYLPVIIIAIALFVSKKPTSH